MSVEFERFLAPGNILVMLYLDTIILTALYYLTFYVYLCFTFVDKEDGRVEESTSFVRRNRATVPRFIPHSTRQRDSKILTTENNTSEASAKQLESNLHI